MDTIQAKSVDSHNNKSEKYEVRIEESLTVPGEKPTKLKHNKIFFVGCWNRRDANNNNYCTTAVLNDRGVYLIHLYFSNY